MTRVEGDPNALHARHEGEANLVEVAQRHDNLKALNEQYLRDAEMAEAVRRREDLARLRVDFASRALLAMIESGCQADWSRRDMARTAVEYADLLVAELAGEP